MADPYAGWAEETLPEPPADPYAGWAEEPVEMAAEDKHAALKELFTNSLSQDSERQAGVEQLVRYTGAPADVVDRQYDTFKRTWEAAQFDPEKWATENPELARLVLERPHLAGVAMKDEKVSGLAKWLREMKAAWDFWGGLGVSRDEMAHEGPPTSADVAQSTEAKQAALGQKLKDINTPRQVPTITDPAAQTSGPGRIFEIAAAEYRRNEKSIERSRAGFEILARKRLGQNTWDLEKRVLDLDNEMVVRDYNQGPVEQLVVEAMSVLPSQVESFKGMGVGGAIGWATGSALGLAAEKATGAEGLRKKAGAAGLSVGAKAGTFLSSFELETGSSFLEYRNMKTDDGRQVDETTAAGFAVIYGFAAASIESASFGFQLQQMGPLGQAIRTGSAKAFLAAKLKDRTFVEMAKRAGAAWLKSTGSEAGEEFLQSVTEDALGYLARSTEAGELQSAQPFEAFVKGAESARLGALGGAVMATPTSALNLSSHLYLRDKAARAGEQVAALANLGDAPTVRAAPDAVAKMVEQATADTGEPVTHLYVDGQSFTKLFQADNVDPADMARELLGEDGPRLLQEAVATQGMLEIPVAAYLEKLGPTDVAKRLAEDTTTAPWIPTIRKAREQAPIIEHQAKELAEQAEARQEQASAIEQKLDVMEEQLVATRRLSKSDSKTAMEPWRRFIATALTRFGQEQAEEIFGRLQILIGRGDAATGQTTFPAAQPAESTATIPEPVPPPPAGPGPSGENTPPAVLSEAAPAPAAPPEPAAPAEASASATAPAVLPTPAEVFGEMFVEELVEESALSPSERQAQALEAFLQEDDPEAGVEPGAMDGTESAAFRHLRQRLSGDGEAGRLSAEERAKDEHVDDVSGLRNRAAWDATPRVPGKLVAVITSPDVKAINDEPTGGHDTANALLAVIGRVIGTVDPGASRSGTNFLLEVEDEAALAAAMDAVRQALPDPAIAIEGGLGPDVDAAFKAVDAVVQEKRNSGALQPRGKTAIDLTRLPELEQALVAKAAELPSAAQPLSAEMLQDERTDDDLFRTVYEDRFSPGVLSGVGWRRIPRKKYTLAIDLKGIKKVNDKVGKDAGDALLRLFGNSGLAAGGAALDFAHLSGDEYAAQADTPALLEAFRDDLAARLRDVGVVVTLSNGESETLRAEFRHGLAEGTYGAADRALNRAKRAESEAEDSGGAGRVSRRKPGGEGDGGGGDVSGPAGVAEGRGDASSRRGGAAGEGDREGGPEITGSRAEGEGASASGEGAAEANRVIPAHLDAGDVAEFEAAISRMRKPENIRAAQAWLDYSLNHPATDPEPTSVTDDQAKAFMNAGIFPDGFVWRWDERGHSMERPIGKRKRSKGSSSVGQDAALKQARAMRSMSAEEFSALPYHYFKQEDRTRRAIESIDEIIARQKHREAHIEALQAEAPSAREFPMRHGGKLLVSKDPSKPGKWRVTRFEIENGEAVPTGHSDARDYAHAIEIAADYSDLGYVKPPAGTKFFQADKKKQAPKNLLVQHNISGEGLLHADELGGLAAPSLAVSRVEHPLEGFGEITLLGPSNMVDPKSGTPTFESDIYSPRHPRAQFHVVAKEARRIIDWLAPFAKQLDDYVTDLDEEIGRSGAAAVAKVSRFRTPLKLAWLHEQGITLEVPTRPARLSHTLLEMSAMEEFFRTHGVQEDVEEGGAYHVAMTEAVKKAAVELVEVFHNEKVDPGSTEEAKTRRRALNQKLVDGMLDDLISEKEGLLYIWDVRKFVKDGPKIGTVEADPQAFEDAVNARVAGREAVFSEWAEAKLKPAEGERYISKVSETTGNRRKIPYTMENILREMTRKVRQGEDFNYGLGTARAAGAKKFRSLKQIQDARNKIVSKEQFQALKDKLDERFGGLVEKLQEHHPDESVHIMRLLDSVAMAIGESYKKGRNIQRELELVGFQNVPTELVREVADIATDLLAMPTEYFEAKPQRAVVLNEFAVAVVPNNARPAVLNVLKKNGLKVETYDSGKEGARDAAIAKASRESDLLFQGESGSVVRGWTESPAKGGLERMFRIALTKDSNLSTFLHESAHVFLEVFGDLAERADAPEQVRTDWATTLKYLGVESRERIAVEHHEKFARSFEGYLWEGKAPSPELVGAFRRFQTWLTRIYRTIADLGVELNDEIRGVFDRLVATDLEIARMESKMGLDLPVFRSTMDMARALGRAVQPEEWREYLAAKEKATSHANARLAHRILKDKLRETEAWWKEEERRQREMADEKYDALPVVRALRYIRSGELTWTSDDGVVRSTSVDAVTRLNKDAVLELLEAKEVPAALKGLVRSLGKVGGKLEPGLHPDEVAELFGYPTGKELLQALQQVPDRKGWVDAETKATMLDLHGDIFLERDRLREEAAKGLHGDYTAQWLLKEWAILRKKSGQGPAPIEAVKRAAELLVERRRVGKLNVGGTLAQERAAAEKCAKAAAKGDYAQAAVLKQQQLLNMFLHKALLEARDERESFVALADKLSDDKARARLGKASPVYRDGVDAILEALGLREPEQRDAPLASLAEVVAQMAQDGATVMLDEEALGKILAQPRPWKDLSVSEMRAVDDALRNIQGAARARSTVLLEGQRVDKEQVVTELLSEAMHSLPDLAPLASTLSSETVLEKLGGVWSAIDGSLLKPEVMVRWLGGGSTTSMWFRSIVKPLQEAKAKEVDLLKRTVKPILDAFQKMPKGIRARFMERIDGTKLFPGHSVQSGQPVQAPRYRYELLMMALNAGNEGNLERLTEGRSITRQHVQAAIDLLTKEEMDWVQSVWDAAESLWPEVQALEERDSGLAPKKIPAVPVQTKHGLYRGGYFPAIYDRRFEAVGERQQAEALAGLMDPSFSRPATAKSHTKKRAAHFSAAISLEPGNIVSHMTQVAHDLAYREALKSVGGLILNPEVQATLKERLGDGRAKQFLQWVKDVASMRGVEGIQHAAALMKLVRAVKGNTVIAVLGYSIPTAMGDLSNLLAAPFGSDLQVKHWAAGLMEMARAPLESMAAVEEKSGELRTRRDMLQRELVQQVKKLTAKGPLSTGPLAWMKEHAFALFEAVDRFTTTPIWMGAYRQGLAQGLPEAEAVTFADATVRQLFPSHSPVDLAPVLRDKGFIGASLMFYGFFSQAYNVNRNILHRLHTAEGAGETALESARVGARLLAYSLAVSAFAELLSGRGREDDEEWEAWLLRKTLAGWMSSLPFGGDLATQLEAKVLDKRSNPRQNGLVGVATSVGDAVLALGDEGADPDKQVRDLIRALGPVLGLPVSQPIRTGQYLGDLVDGDAQPEGPLDVASGLIYGERKGQPANILKDATGP